MEQARQLAANDPAAGERNANGSLAAGRVGIELPEWVGELESLATDSGALRRERRSMLGRAHYVELLQGSHVDPQ